MAEYLIPYTHWAYFDDRTAADTCAADLDTSFDCLAAVDRSYDDSEWLLRAARTVSLDWPNGWHGEIAEVVERHGGRYDGGESGWLDTATGEYVEQAEGRNDA
jgi:hypothetical protein